MIYENVPQEYLYYSRKEDQRHSSWYLGASHLESTSIKLNTLTLKRNFHIWEEALKPLDNWLLECKFKLIKSINLVQRLVPVSSFPLSWWGNSSSFIKHYISMQIICYNMLALIVYRCHKGKSTLNVITIQDYQTSSRNNYTFHAFKRPRWMCTKEIICNTLHCAFQPATGDAAKGKRCSDFCECHCYCQEKNDKRDIVKG